MYARWQSDSVAMRSSLKISSGYNSWTRAGAIPGVQCLGVPRHPRFLDVLDCAWAARLRKIGGAGLEACRKGWFVNLSQGVCRRPWGPGTRTLCTSSLVYSYEMDRVLRGDDAMRLQGWPRHKLHKFSSHTLRDLAGEAFALPTMACVMYCLYLNPMAPWWKPAVAEGTG